MSDRPLSPTHIPKLQSDFAEILSEYDMFHQEFSQAFCSKGEDHKYRQLLTQYRGNGIYLPQLPDGTLDLQTIQENLPLLEEKLKWLKKITENYEKQPALSRTARQNLLKPVEDTLKELLDLKHQHRFEKNVIKAALLINQSEKSLRRLQEQYSELLKQTPYLLTFQHPVDHFQNRKNFDALRGKEDPKSKRLSNTIFFQRKLFEDGTFTLDKSRSDTFLRTTLDTLALRLPHEKGLISEETRYDLEWSLRQIQVALSQGRNLQLQRLQNWTKRTERNLTFYEGLFLKDENEERTLAKTSPLAKTLAQEKSEATAAIRDFVLKKNAEIYHHLRKKPEHVQALYVIEQTLYNEIGAIQEGDELDRLDIIQVILNRVHHPYYSQIPISDALHSYLNLSDKELKKNPWLNTFFKQGEFSFTYFFIPSVSTLFCPDQTRAGRSLRKQNLELAVQGLKNPRFDFDALRYFSRKSMTGRIPMNAIWENYTALPEQPGNRIEPPSSLIATLKSDSERKTFQYLYSFQDSENTSYDVIQTLNRIYTVKDLETHPQVFHYRSPPDFTFFRPASHESTPAQK
jgi:hypothetical protein